MLEKFDSLDGYVFPGEEVKQKSIRQLGHIVFNSPWRQKFFSLFGERTHLKALEDDEVRANFPDPRIHYALNCASISCPMLRNEAYVATKLNAQLEDQAKVFIRDSSRNVFKDGKLELSKIFDWYSGDFKKSGKSVQEHVAGYMTDDKATQDKIKAAKDITYMEYNWGLNIVK